jgi:hypothetical protein
LVELQKRSRPILSPEPPKSGIGENYCIELASIEFGEARVHISPQRSDLYIGTGARNQRLTPHRTRAHACAFRQIGEEGAAVRDKGIAGIFARQHCGNCEPRRQRDGNILHRVNRQIDALIQQRLFQLLGEQPLATGFGQRTIQNAVTGGFHGHQLAHHPASGERVAHDVGLRECQPRAAGAEAKRLLRYHGFTLQPSGTRNEPVFALSALTVLGLETSCDETAAAVVRGCSPGPGEILSNVVLSQLDEHSPFGGVVPEIAARAHVEALDGVIEAAMAQAGIPPRELDAVAATAGPGLIGGVMVGLTTAKALALAWDKPLI